jgi:hypothetical protein
VKKQVKKCFEIDCAVVSEQSGIKASKAKDLGDGFNEHHIGK